MRIFEDTVTTQNIFNKLNCILVKNANYQGGNSSSSEYNAATFKICYNVIRIYCRRNPHTITAYVYIHMCNRDNSYTYRLPLMHKKNPIPNVDIAKIVSALVPIQSIKSYIQITRFTYISLNVRISV